MLLGGYSSCQGCGCVPCKACTAECTNPHTGDAFEVVYTRYALGVQAGNLTDGYLTAEGDNDTDDPVDGMDGSGPWYQRVSGEFTLGGPTPSTRLPCSVLVSFWRTSSPLGASSPPGPSTALTENTIEVIVTSGALVFADGSVITSADGAVAVSSVPSVGSSADPRTGEGTVSFASQCWNVETIFTVRATIRWNVQKRQHTLYGVVRECYEEGTPCATVCSGSPPPTSLYLTISNPVVTSGTYSGTFPSGTYVMDRVPTICNTYSARTTGDCTVGGGYFTDLQGVNAFPLNSGIVFFAISSLNNGVCGSVVFDAKDPLLLSPCGTGVIASGTASWSWLAFYMPGNYPAYGTLNWKVSA